MKTAAVIVALLVTLSQAPTWKTYTSPAGRFTTEFPGTAEPALGRDTATGVAQVIFRNELGVYVILYLDYAPNVLNENDDDALMNADRDSFVHGVKGKVFNERSAACGQYPGRRFVVDSAEGGPYPTRMCLARPRTYMIIAMQAGKTPQNIVEHFLDAFRILPAR